jgi:hypothetical protein
MESLKFHNRSIGYSIGCDTQVALPSKRLILAQSNPCVGWIVFLPILAKDATTASSVHNLVGSALYPDNVVQVVLLIILVPVLLYLEIGLVLPCCNYLKIAFSGAGGV